MNACASIRPSQDRCPALTKSHPRCDGPSAEPEQNEERLLTPNGTLTVYGICRGKYFFSAVFWGQGRNVRNKKELCSAIDVLFTVGKSEREAIYYDVGVSSKKIRTRLHFCLAVDLLPPAGWRVTNRQSASIVIRKKTCRWRLRHMWRNNFFIHVLHNTAYSLPVFLFH